MAAQTTIPMPRDERPSPSSDEERVEGVVKRIVFANPDNGWTVLKLMVRGRGELAAVGTLPGVRDGDTVKVWGRYRRDPKFGKQLAVERYEVVPPATLVGIERYLSSGAVDGVGPTMAKRLVQAFGLETLSIIEHEPERLREVPGIGKVRSQRMTEALRDQHQVRDLMVFLQGHGVSASHAAKIQARYGDDALRQVKAAPHRMARDIHGFGFITADKIARDVGLDHDAHERAVAGVEHVLQRASDRGHVVMEKQQLLRSATELLSVDPTITSRALEALLRDGHMVDRQCRGDSQQRGELIAMPRWARAEEDLAARLRGLISQTSLPFDIDVVRAVRWYEERSGLELSASQSKALEAILEAKVVVLTGGPGTGKTTLVRGVVEILGRKGLRIQLAAPTGRAARRLQEATGRDAHTVHRLLEYRPETQGFARGPQQPLAADVLVIDEASMLDVRLAQSVVAALPHAAQLVLVGDVDQLPSIGPGRVLADLIDSGVLPVVRLEEVYRQERASLIVQNAHRVRVGLMPISGDADSDFFFIERDTPEAISATLAHLVVERIPNHFKLSPASAIQVLTPMQRGRLGAAALNAELQALINPGGEEVRRGGHLLRVGDRVMQRRNNYDLGVANGDIGRVLGFDYQAQRASVDFEGRVVLYPWSELHDLSLAYACSIHKSQGSEYPAVVIALHTQHFALLERHLLYTAITRGRRLVVIVGSRRALDIAVRHTGASRRETLLVEHLRGEVR